MKQRTVTNVLLLALLVFNVGFVGSWWYGHWKAHRMMREEHKHFSGHGSKAGMFLAKQLGLNDEQVQKLEALRKEHFDKIGLMEAAVDRNEKNMMDALMANPTDSAKANMCADSVGILKADIQKELFSHFSSIKKICTPEQNAKFDSLVKEMMAEFPHHWDSYRHESKELHHDSI